MALTAIHRARVIWCSAFLALSACTAAPPSAPTPIPTPVATATPEPPLPTLTPVQQYVTPDRAAMMARFGKAYDEYNWTAAIAFAQALKAAFPDDPEVQEKLFASYVNAAAAQAARGNVAEAARLFGLARGGTTDHIVEEHLRQLTPTATPEPATPTAGAIGQAPAPDSPEATPPADGTGTPTPAGASPAGPSPGAEDAAASVDATGTPTP